VFKISVSRHQSYHQFNALNCDMQWRKIQFQSSSKTESNSSTRNAEMIPGIQIFCHDRNKIQKREQLNSKNFECVSKNSCWSSFAEVSKQIRPKLAYCAVILTKICFFHNAQFHSRQTLARYTVELFIIHLQYFAYLNIKISCLLDTQETVCPLHAFN